MARRPRPGPLAPAEPMPADLRPMLATSGPMPRHPADYAFEFKWDGVRLLAYLDGRATRLALRTGADTTARYPELAGLAGALGRRAILDGEVIAAGAAGEPSFHALQRRMHVRSPSAALQRSAPVYLMIFDVLYLDDAATLARPYAERRDLLDSLGLEAERWRTPPARRARPEPMLALARRESLEGLIAKRLDSPYEPGRRSAAWIKIKLRQRQEFIVGGYRPGRGAAAGGVGSLLLGYHDRRRPGRAATLRFAGNVGTGLTDADRRALKRRLDAARLAHSPFADRVPFRDAVFARPVLVAEVEFAEWTPRGHVRQASFRGLRTDKPPADVVRERPARESAA